MTNPTEVARCILELDEDFRYAELMGFNPNPYDILLVVYYRNNAPTLARKYLELRKNMDTVRSFIARAHSEVVKSVGASGHTFDPEELEKMLDLLEEQE